MRSVNEGFQIDFKKIENTLKAIHPEISDRDINIFKMLCKSMVSNAIQCIGNSINEITHTIEQ